MDKKLKILMIDDEGISKSLFKDIEENLNVIDNKIEDYKIILETEESFDKGKEKIQNNDYDIIILDLCDKNDKEFDKIKSGSEILNEIKKIEFVPIIFYSGMVQYLDEDFNSDLVKVVEKSKGFVGLQDEIRSIISSFPFKIKNEINLISKEILREYLWEFVHEQWDEFTDVELESLKHLIIKRFSNKLYHESLNEEEEIHPILFYQYPQINKEIFETGTIIKKDDTHYVIISPSCDLAQKKIEKVALLECFELKKHPKYIEINDNIKKFTDENKESKLEKEKNKLNSFLNSNGGTSNKEFILPETFFFSGFYLDFQHILIENLDNLDSFENIGKINSPFVEKLINKFSSNYNRIGTPDINHFY